MSVWSAWFTTVLLIVVGILTLHHLGVNVDATVSATLHHLVRILGRPLYFG
jgi:hypothetical protein